MIFNIPQAKKCICCSGELLIEWGSLEPDTIDPTELYPEGERILRGKWTCPDCECELKGRILAVKAEVKLNVEKKKEDK